MTVALIIWMWWAALASITLAAALTYAIITDLMDGDGSHNPLGTIIAAIALLLLLQCAALSGLTAWGLSS